jgi:hypothetical protein
MPRRKKTAAELKAENTVLRRGNIAQAVASVFINLIRWAAVSFVAWCVYSSIKVLSGQQTEANIAISFLGNVKISEALAYALTGGSIIYAYRERRLRQKTVERVQTRVQRLESERDPRRTSSRLTPRGETHPRDIN